MIMSGKLSGKIDGELITREFFPQFVGSENRINCGHCYFWAYVAYKLYEDVQLMSNDNHAFLYQRGEYFDAEAPYGEETMDYLRSNVFWAHENTFIEEDMDVDEFINYWDSNGRYEFSFDKINELDEKIEDFLCRHFDRG